MGKPNKPVDALRLPPSHRTQMRRDRVYAPYQGEISIAEYRRVRNRMRSAIPGSDDELQLREAMDSIWFRLPAVSQQRINREYAAWLREHPQEPAEESTESQTA